MEDFFMRTSILAAAVSLAALAVLSVAPSLGFAASVVTVSLWDKGAEMGMPPGLGMGMSGDMSMATMGITATPDTVTAGPVTFNVTNDSTDLIHEMLVIPVPADGSLLPYVDDEERVDEEAAHHLGEVSELDPGKSGSLTVDLDAGKYVLVCNIAGHYMAGMWTIIDVTP
jgi:uncharacterized cupredoxin-like copper-binding protein